MGRLRSLARTIVGGDDGSEAAVALIFVSYTKTDRDWAFWIGQELDRLGHVAQIHEWEVSAGGNIVSWMERSLDEADQVLCVISQEYLSKDYSTWERQSAQWAAATDKRNFLLPVFIEDCEATRLLAPLKRCELFGFSEPEARSRLEQYLEPAGRPQGKLRFPGGAKTSGALQRPSARVVFPGGRPKTVPTSGPSETSTSGFDLTDASTIVAAETVTGPWSILTKATAQVPAVRYAIGVAGIAAAVAIATTLTKGYSSVTILAVGLLFAAMVALYLFSMLVSSNTKATRYAGIALVWSVVLFNIIVMIFTMTSVAMNWPCNWMKILSLPGSCDFAARSLPSSLPRVTTESPIELPAPRDEPYYHPRFGYMILYPSNYFTVMIKEDTGGAIFESEPSKLTIRGTEVMRLELYGQPIKGPQSLTDIFNALVKDEKVIYYTYCALFDDRLVVSGTYYGGRMFYLVYQTKADYIKSFKVTFPTLVDERMENLITMMYRSFTGERPKSKAIISECKPSN